MTTKRFHIGSMIETQIGYQKSKTADRQCVSTCDNTLPSGEYCNVRCTVNYHATIALEVTNKPLYIAAQKNATAIQNILLRTYDEQV